MLKRLLGQTWLALRRQTHGFDFSKEPEIQHQARDWLSRHVRAMEYDPHTQWKFHLVMSWVWIVSAVPILALFFWSPHEWMRWGLLITLLYSLYANFVSDFTGLHAAWAAMRGNQIYSTKKDVAKAEEHIIEHVEESADEIVEKINGNGK